MISFRFKHVCLESLGVHFPTTALSSTEIESRLTPVYERLRVPFGTLERVSGCQNPFYVGYLGHAEFGCNDRLTEALENLASRPISLGR